MNRESIYSAVFNLVRAVPGLAFSSRRLLHWADVPPIQQPALFQVQKGEPLEYQGNQAKWTLGVDLYLYVHAGTDPNISPTMRMNPLLDAIEAKFQPAVGYDAQTLGGLVQRCRISGRIETDEGVLGEQAIAIIPIEILVAAG